MLKIFYIKKTVVILNVHLIYFLRLIIIQKGIIEKRGKQEIYTRTPEASCVMPVVFFFRYSFVENYGNLKTVMSLVLSCIFYIKLCSISVLVYLVYSGY